MAGTVIVQDAKYARFVRRHAEAAEATGVADFVLAPRRDRAPAAKASVRDP